MTVRSAAIPAAMLLLCVALAPPAAAQSATIRGRLVDEQGQVVAGATVTVKDVKTGATHTDETSAEGLYGFAGLPAGVYDLRAERQGFTTVEQRSTIVDVGAVVQRDFTLTVAPVKQSVEVTAPTPLIETGSPAVGGVVGPRRIEELPLNGRQFANLAATLLVVGIGYHRDPTKGTQYTPQVG